MLTGPNWTTGRHLGEPIPLEELVDADEFFANPEHFH